MKHGEGTYFYMQHSCCREYAGQWVQEEFNGIGQFRVLDESIAVLARDQPTTIIKYRGRFACAEGLHTFLPGPARLEVDRNKVAFDKYFPRHVRSISCEWTSRDFSEDGEPLMVQGPGLAPEDFAKEQYGLDGGDLQHCGPDQDACDIWYADGAHYTGPCLAGAVPHGSRGILVEPSGSMFEGAFDKGLRAGSGRLTLANGICYEGDFKKPGGYRHGHGSLTIPEALHAEAGLSTYIGTYVEGLRSGVGDVTFPSGARYKGYFDGNLRHGRGVFVVGESSTGAYRYEGPWEQDQATGDKGATIKYQSGHVYAGGSLRGRRHGHGRFYGAPSSSAERRVEDRLVYVGQWEEDAMHGDGELRCADGVYKGQFVRGARSGRGRFDYSKPIPGSALPQVAKKRGDQPVSCAQARFYEGEWAQDQPHGAGTYSDEYGTVFTDALMEQGALRRDADDREQAERPRGFGGRYLSAGGRTPTFAPVVVEASPTGAMLPRAPLGDTDVDLRAFWGSLSPAESESMRGFDVGSGVAHARVRPAHLGIEGVPGSRWA